MYACVSLERNKLQILQQNKYYQNTQYQFFSPHLVMSQVFCGDVEKVLQYLCTYLLGSDQRRHVASGR